MKVAAFGFVFCALAFWFVIGFRGCMNASKQDVWRAEAKIDRIEAKLDSVLARLPR